MDSLRPAAGQTEEEGADGGGGEEGSKPKESLHTLPRLG